MSLTTFYLIKPQGNTRLNLIYDENEGYIFVSKLLDSLDRIFFRTKEEAQEFIDSQGETNNWEYEEFGGNEMYYTPWKLN